MAIEFNENLKDVDEEQSIFLDDFVSDLSKYLWTIRYELDLMSDIRLTETLQEIFRQVHSLKGASQVFGRKDLASMAHNLESHLANWQKNIRTVRVLHIEIILGSYLSIFHSILMELRSRQDFREFQSWRELST